MYNFLKLLQSSISLLSGFEVLVQERVEGRDLISLIVLSFILLQVYVMQNREDWAKPEKITKSFKLDTLT